MTKSYCGGRECHGHGDYAICGKPYYDPEPWQCPRCRIKDLEQGLESLLKAYAELQERYDLAVNPEGK